MTNGKCAICKIKDKAPHSNSWCLSCTNLKHKEYREKYRLQALTYYSKGKLICECCQEKLYEFLTIDHIEGGGNKHKKEISKGKSWQYDLARWLVANKFPKGFRVLCYNCNCSIGHKGYCPHERIRNSESRDIVINRL